VKCNSDTLHLSAPTGFLNYAWSNNNNTDPASSKSVIINPTANTTYYVRAEKAPGCFAYDTVHVRVNNSAPIHLGADTSICAGSTLVLNAGSGFAKYLWSTGSTDSILSITAKGTYHVQGWGINGCRSSDTFMLKEVYQNPVPRLIKDSVLCFGVKRTLQAGTGYRRWQWSTGATSATIDVDSIGTYSVLVTDQNGCKGSDSMSISSIRPLPSNFLPHDTAVCSYGSIQLKPNKKYQNYLWNTGQQASETTISKPSLYWLMVVDEYGCRGFDSVLVRSKQCLEGFFIPNAFTPNGDGLNDIFRPLVFGNIQQYKFAVYNRWGEIVFETTEPNAGWNGGFKGATDKTSLFTWICSYKLDGQDRKAEKGTVVLIR
jgi:gliding motility-associated-like protein